MSEQAAEESLDLAAELQNSVSGLLGKKQLDTGFDEVLVNNDLDEESDVCDNL